MANFQNLKFYILSRNMATTWANDIGISQYFEGRYRYWKSVNDPSSILFH